MKQINTHTFQVSDELSFDVRHVMREGAPWFVAKDVAEALGYLEAKGMTRMLDDDEKGVHIVPTLGGNQEMTIINESGLYSAIIGSRKPEAKEFKRWVTKVVLPSIRKHGAYVAGQEDLPEALAADLAADAKQKEIMMRLHLQSVCGTLDKYNKAQKAQIAEAYRMAVAVMESREMAYFPQDVLSELLVLREIPHRRWLQKQSTAKFNEAFRIDEYNKEALKKHRSGESSWDPDLLTYKDHY